MASYVMEKQVKMAILAVPAEVAQSVTNELVSSGVQAILNFSPIHLKVPDHVIVNSVDLALELEHLSYFIK
jgi:redox-sensing transcriptional repressor